MKLKFIGCIFIVFCAVFLFAGCSTVSYTTEIDSDGGVSNQITAEVDAEYLKTKGMTSAEITNLQNEILNKINSYYSNKISGFTHRVMVDSEITSTEKLLLTNSVKYNSEIKDNICSAKITFSSVGVYYYFNEYDPSADEEEENKKETLFFTKEIAESTTIFGAMYDEDTTITEHLTNYFKTYLKTYLDDSVVNALKQPDLYYCYSTNNPSLKSDATSIVYDGGQYTHIFKINPSTPQQVITLYSLTPKREVWYISALIGAFGLAIILFIYCAIKGKGKTKNEDK